ncbi:putative mitochondrial carrier [Trichinella pseudospiralis]|nr:putative mitochondrial carrier -like protein [Trichinella pseudospiralis]KRZ33158.1 putative mitochondrial carrier [Trichinella pseudospiralis]KRZ39599.1 putative mitochondrial carrier -like protein [Trichinella pseudospiralis]
MRETANRYFGPATNFFLFGTAAGIGRTIAHPFSVLKIQTESGMPGGRMGIFKGAYWIYKQEGAGGFVKALPISVARIVPHVAIQCTIFNHFTKNMKPVEKPNSTRAVKLFTYGCIGNTIATLITHPLDVVKTRLLVQPSTLKRQFYRDTADVFTKMVKTEGLFSLYRGLLPSIIGGCIFSGTMFSAWDICDGLPWRVRGAEPFIIGESYLLGMIAVSAACFASQPFDVIRHKVMASSPRLPNYGYTDAKGLNILSLTWNAYKINGIPGFFHGVVPNLCKVVPQVTCYMLFISVMSNMFKPKLDLHQSSLSSLIR